MRREDAEHVGWKEVKKWKGGRERKVEREENY